LDENGRPIGEAGSALVPSSSKEGAFFGSSSQSKVIHDEPAAYPLSSISYYWLAVRAWWFDLGTFGDTPRPSAQLSDLGKVTKIRIMGDDQLVEYDTIGQGGNSVLELLNDQQSGFSTYYGFRFLPEGTERPVNPYVALMPEPRKNLEDFEPGSSEFNPDKYTVLHRYQLPVFDGGSLTFYKPFFNIYSETLDVTKIAFATQPKKFSSTGSLSAKSSRNHGETFDGQNSALFSVNHAYLIGKLESGVDTVKPRNTSSEVHVFIRTGEGREGAYSVVSSGNSRFAVNDVVYWQNYSLYSLEPNIYRHGTISSISRGTFTYTANDIGSTASYTGLRIVINLSTNLTLDFSSFSYLSNSSIIATFPSIENALESTNAFWVNRFRLLGGFQNAWVTQSVDGRDLAVPSKAASYIGESFFETERMDCSKAGKAYFIQSSYLLIDTPPWRSQENYHDGDTVAQRPGLTSTGSSQFQSRVLRARYIELDCSKNSITRSEIVETSYAATSNTEEARIAGMPSWFPSKRYRQAGYSGALNLNKNETVASVFSSSYDPVIGANKYFIEYWPLDQSLSIEEIVQMIINKAGSKKIDVTDSIDKLNEEINVPESAGPSRWGYTYTTEYLVSL
jgi:hypothetical protein